MKKNFKKKVAPIALTGLILVGASAWLTNTETQVGVNKIKSGTAVLKFVDSEDAKRQDTVITLKGDSLIPMTEAHANKVMKPYNFTLKNSGAVDLDYTLYMVEDESEFVTNVINVDIDGLANNKIHSISDYTVVDGNKHKLDTGTIKAGESKKYDKVIMFASEGAKNPQMLKADGSGRTGKYHLEVVAEQHIETPAAETLATGQKLSIEGKEYTVIENVQGNQYKVLTTDLANNGQEMKFGDNSNYATSTIATFLNGDYYNSLDPKIQNAIIETPVQQKDLKAYEGNNSTDWDTPKDAGTHKVFLPSWEEITKAAGGSTPTILQTFLNDKSLWLRDTYGSLVLYVDSSGDLGDFDPDFGDYVRPAMVLDLAKVNYSKI